MSGSIRARARRSSGWFWNSSRMQVAAIGGWVICEIRRPSNEMQVPHQIGPGM